MFLMMIVELPHVRWEIDKPGFSRCDLGRDCEQAKRYYLLMEKRFFYWDEQKLR